GMAVSGGGMEVGEQLDWLRQLQVPYAQGFYLGMPAPADHLTALLRTGRPRGVARVPLKHHAEAGRHRRGAVPTLPRPAAGDPPPPPRRAAHGLCAPRSGAAP